MYVHVQQLCKRYPIKTQGTCLIGTLLCQDWDRGHLEIFNAFILIQGLHFADDIQGFSYIK